MNLKISGRVRNRVRIDLLFFTISGPWRSTPFEWSLVIQPGPVRSFPLPGTDLDLDVSLAGTVLNVDAVSFGIDIHLFSVDLQNGTSEHAFSCEPFKGVRIEGRLQIGQA